MNQGQNYVKGHWVDNVEMAAVEKLVERGTLFELVPHSRPFPAPTAYWSAARGATQVLH